MSLEAACKADRRFARRFPERECWLRPATPAERKAMFHGHVGEGWHPCVAVYRQGDVYRNIPFLSSSRDIADAYDSTAANTAVKAAEALRGGGIAHIIATRSGRPL